MQQRLDYQYFKARTYGADIAPLHITTCIASVCVPRAQMMRYTCVMCIFCQQRPKSGTATQDETLFSRTSEAKLFQLAKHHFSAAHRQDTKKADLRQYPERIIRLFLFFEAKTELVKPSNEPPKALPTPKLRIITIFSFHPTKRLKEANTELMNSSNIFTF